MNAALAWWAENRPAARDMLEIELVRAFDQIVATPNAGQRGRGRHANVRRLLLQRTEYFVYYRVDEPSEAVHVVRFVHARRRGA